MDRRFHLKSRLLTAEHDGWLFVLDIDTGRVHRFNDAARIVFQLCLEPRSTGEIAAAYQQTFDLDSALAAADVGEVLAHMASLDLFRETGEG